MRQSIEIETDGRFCDILQRCKFLFDLEDIHGNPMPLCELFGVDLLVYDQETDHTPMRCGNCLEATVEL